MPFCTNCGQKLGEQEQACPSCGAVAVPFKAAQSAPDAPSSATNRHEPQEQQPVQTAQPAPPAPPVQIPPVQQGEGSHSSPQGNWKRELTADQLPEKFRPLGAWAYVGWSLLFALPIAGFILLIVFSFSDTNINRRNYARAYFCAMLLALIVTVGLAIIAGALGLSLAGWSRTLTRIMR